VREPLDSSLRSALAWVTNRFRFVAFHPIDGLAYARGDFFDVARAGNIECEKDLRDLLFAFQLRDIGNRTPEPVRSWWLIFC
jgi:hypothetical protein